MKEIKSLKYIKRAGITDPKSIVAPDTLSEKELIEAIRLSIVAEHDAIILYETYANATNDPTAKEIFQHVADEEKVHVGEFQALLEKIGGNDEKNKNKEGLDEAQKHMGE